MLGSFFRKSSKIKIPNEIQPGDYMSRHRADQHVLHLSSEYAPAASRRLTWKMSAVKSRRGLDAFILAEAQEDTEDHSNNSYPGFLRMLNQKICDRLNVDIASEDEQEVFEQLKQLVLETEYDDERTSILKSVPPADVHRMQHGADWIGDNASAAIVHDALEQAGVALKAGDRFFDYGCSSGSLLRLLAYLYENIAFVGTDPVDSSIDWAQKNLTFDNLQFYHQDQTAPIEALQNESVDILSAISIFSHHGMRASQAWLSELHRILKKDGVAVITTHGIGAVRHYNSLEHKPLERYKCVALSLLAQGYAFEEVWLGQDDAGNTATDADWGSTYFSQEVMGQMLEGQFEVLLHSPRMNQGNQDVYVLRKI